MIRRGAEHEVPRLAAGVPGLDQLTGGGLPENRLTLVAGTAGSGKTVFAAQFLAAGIVADGAPGVFVTFEERPQATRQNLRSLGLRIGEWEEQGLWSFVDAAPHSGQETVVLGRYDLSSLVQRVAHSVQRAGARRVAIDSVGALIARFDDVGPARAALFELACELEKMGVTTVMTVERPDDYGPISRFGFEEFVADNVLLLRNALDGEKRRRTIEVLKLRGGSHMRGEHLFTLLAGEGTVVVPQESFDFAYESSQRRLSSGNLRLDQMLGGGLYEKSIVLVSGATGTGKSLMATQFVAGGIQNGERSLLLSFEESRDQLVRNAETWGIAFEEMEREGRLRVVAVAPESASLEDHLLRMKATIEEFRPNRVAIDSITALQRVATLRSFRDYLLGLTFHIKRNALLGMVTSSSTHGDNGLPLSDLHFSTISDAIVVLHYVPIGGSMRRGVHVLKLRGSAHERELVEYRIDDRGMHIEGPFPDDVFADGFAWRSPG